MVSGSGRVGFVLWACLLRVGFVLWACLLKVCASNIPSCCITCVGKCLWGSAPTKQRRTCFITSLCISSIVHCKWIFLRTSQSCHPGLHLQNFPIAFGDEVMSKCLPGSFRATLFFLYKNAVFPAQAEYSYFSADFRLKIFLYYS